MDFRKLIDDRHSIRTFEARPVEREKVERILHAASRAPSAVNLQSYKIALVTGKERIEKLAATKPQQTWIATAPVILVFLGDPEPSTGKISSEGQSLYTVQDPTIACAYAQLAAADEGLGRLLVRSGEHLARGSRCSRTAGDSSAGVDACHRLCGRPTSVHNDAQAKGRDGHRLRRLSFDLDRVAARSPELGARALDDGDEEHSPRLPYPALVNRSPGASDN